MIGGTAGNMYCETFSFRSDRDFRLFVGLWSYRTQEKVEFNGNTYMRTVCEYYDELDYDYDKDSRWRTVMAFSIMAPVLGGILLFCSCLAPCFSVNPAQWKLGGIFCLVVSIFQGVTLLSLQSDICLENPAVGFLESIPGSNQILGTFPDECSWAAGFRLSITAVVFWFLAGVVILATPPPTKPAPDEPETQEVTYQQHPDGTVEKVQVVKGKAVQAPATLDLEGKDAAVSVENSEEDK